MLNIICLVGGSPSLRSGGEGERRGGHRPSGPDLTHNQRNPGYEEYEKILFWLQTSWREAGRPSKLPPSVSKLLIPVLKRPAAQTSCYLHFIKQIFVAY